MNQKFNVVIEKGEDGYFIAQVVGLAGCYTQAKTLDELMSRIKEAIECHIISHPNEKFSNTFVDLQEVEITV